MSRNQEFDGGHQMSLFPEPERLPLARMSPRQFENDPSTVFHASHYKIPEGEQDFHQMYRRSGDEEFGPGLHAGTEQAATERAHALGRFSEWKDDHPDGLQRASTTRNPVMHVLNLSQMGVHQLHEPESDNNINDWDMWDDDHFSKYTPTAYTNGTEDQGSVSVVIPYRHAAIPMTHTDFIDQHLAKGGTLEQLHPVTRHLYERGQLETHREIPLQEPASRTNFWDHNRGLFPVMQKRGLAPERPVSREELAQAKHGTGTAQYKQALTDMYRDDSLGQAAELSKHMDQGMTFAGPASAKTLVEGRVSDRGDLRRGQQFREQS